MTVDVKAERKALIEEVLKEYPEKTAKKRAKHLNVYEEGAPDCGVKSNVKSIPGVMTVRGCAYAGAKVWCGDRSRTWCMSVMDRSVAAIIPGRSGATIPPARSE